MANHPYYNPFYFHDLSQPFLPSIPPPPQQHVLPQAQPQQQLQTASLEAANVEEEGNTDKATKKSVRERWSPDDEKVLVQLWADNNERLESKDSRKVWDDIVKALNEKRKIKKTVDQCQRKIKHLKNLYKERKDWNRRQSGGHIRKSPHYDEIDKVLGCKDIVTCTNVQQMGTSSSSTSVFNESSSESTTGKSPSPSNSDTSSPSAAASTVSKRQQRKRKGKKNNIQGESDSDEESLSKAVKKMNEEGDQMARVMENMQESQKQQLQLMTQLLSSFNRYMDNKLKKKKKN